jgi:uncharacterized protein with PIN domain
VIIDTSAIVAILKGEPGHERLMTAIATDAEPKLSAATAGETLLFVGDDFTQTDLQPAL